MQVSFRPATRDDLGAVVDLLTDDTLGKTREGSDLAVYEAALEDMAQEGTNQLIVGELGGTVVATYQLAVISGISLGAARRAQIEGVRVRSKLRGRGIGAALMADFEARARAAGAVLLQFTTNASRERAHAFYKRCGFTATHLGFKKPLT